MKKEGRRYRHQPLLTESYTMTIADSDPDAPKRLHEVVKAKRDQIAADNQAAKAARNARRWKVERDPGEYEKQKANQREAYAAQIEAEEGREVRTYVKVPGSTRAEHEENAKARDAERKRNERSRATQNQKDADADKKWAARQRKKGRTDEQINEGLGQRATDRLYRQPEPDAYENNPDFGAI